MPLLIILLHTSVHGIVWYLRKVRLESQHNSWLGLAELIIQFTSGTVRHFEHCTKVFQDGLIRHQIEIVMW